MKEIAMFYGCKNSQHLLNEIGRSFVSPLSLPLCLIFLQMAEDRVNVVVHWEKMEIDILVRIFQKCFSLQELVNSGSAHVCRGWRAACCDPTLWNTLDLSHMKSHFIKVQQKPFVYVESRFDENLTRLLKLSMSLSKGNTMTLIVHFNLFLSDDMLTYTAIRCPNLRRLVLPAWNRIKKKSLANVMECCKSLESLTMPSIPHPYVVFSAIAMNCKNFRELKVMGPIDLSFVEVLVYLLPNLNVISLRCTSIYRDALVTILDKLKRLQVLNISHSYLLVQRYEPKQETIIVRELDETIMNKASKLKRFITCMEHDTCVMCQRTEKDEGIMRWYKYEEGLWKADEFMNLYATT
ncbi:unnamed protein product [Thlaspi arvense]|uniref:F-box domain-containing protein n=1 Tax=Thlaspi arvense TaxID=13288 RepID=A0AAU9RJE9_THLAR|nr:unnamed protein product [Thlaspi arvense]